MISLHIHVVLIQNIYRFVVYGHIASGNLWCDHTDHRSNYLLISVDRQTSQQDRPLVRIFCEKNINNFKNDISRIDWAPVYNSNGVNEGYRYHNL